MASPKKEKRVMRGGAAAAAKRPLPLLRRAILHSFLCFFIGLITGFTPDHWTTTASTHLFRALHAIDHTTLLFPHHYPPAPAHPQPPPLQQPQLLVVVTVTDLSDPERRSAGLTRTAHALSLVSPPVLWLVVEPAREAPPTARLLRGAAHGLVYRHLTYRDNFTDAGVERHHQRNYALGHIEQHRLAGVVLFAGLGDVYDLRFFHQLREIRKFGAWPVATVSEYERKVVVEGPACSGSPWAVTGWFTVDTAGTAAARSSPTVRTRPAKMEVRGFGFSSSLLWDPHRWDRFPISEPDVSQDSVKFVQRLVVEEYNTSRGMPNPDCSEIMVWHGDQIISLPTSV